MEKTFLALDAGTTAIKLLLADQDGSTRFASQIPAAPIHGSGGAAETDMQEYWHRVCALTARAAAADPAGWRLLAGICTAAQGDGLWPLDAQGRSFMPAILWQDTRASDLCRGEALAGLQIAHHSNPVFSGSRAAILAWLRKNRPEQYRRISHPLQCGSFLGVKLTGEYATDASNCGDCFDINSGVCVPELYEALGIFDQYDHLPALLPPEAVLGHVTPTAAEETGLPAGVPVLVGCLDATAAAIGSRSARPGRALVCFGTTLLVMCFQSTPPAFPLPEGAYADVLSLPQRCYRLSFGTSSGACAIDYVKNFYFPEMAYDEFYRRLRTIPPGCDGLTFLPFLHGERAPFLCPQARAGFFGRNGTHTVWHKMRACAEGVLFSARHCLDCSGQTVSGVELIGGASRSAALCQIAADVFGMPVYAGSRALAGTIGCLRILQGAGSDASELPTQETPAGENWYIPDALSAERCALAYQRYRRTVEEMLPVWRREPQGQEGNLWI